MQKSHKAANYPQASLFISKLCVKEERKKMGDKVLYCHLVVLWGNFSFSHLSVKVSTQLVLAGIVSRHDISSNLRAIATILWFCTVYAAVSSGVCPDILTGEA